MRALDGRISLTPPAAPRYDFCQNFFMNFMNSPLWEEPMMKRLLLGSLFLVAMPVTAMANEEAVLTVDQLRVMAQEQLDDLYMNAPAGNIPDGQSAGTAVFFPGSLINDPTQMLAALVWQGKVFDRDDGVLVNRVFGFNAIKAEVFMGESLLDGGESIIIDYHDTSLLAKPVRDEIRQVAPTIYLGRAYIRTLLGDFMAVNFILEFPEAF
jgi:hypothetical protein